MSEYISDIEQQAANHHHDLKAEVVIASLIQKGIPLNKIFVKNQSAFKRAHSKDISEIKRSDFKNYEEYLEVILNRDGIYDILPEGLFHPVDANKQYFSVYDMTEEYKQNQIIENETRQFFAPFEYEFFLQNTFQEIQEQKLLDELSSNYFSDFFSNFWQLDKSLPSICIQQFIRLLPYAHLILGKDDLMIKTLELLLQDSVRFSYDYTSSVHLEKNQINLSEMLLGVNSYVGRQASEHLKVLNIQIGPIPKDRITEYLEDGSKYKIVEVFCQFFVSFDLEIKIEAYPEIDSDIFVLNEEDKNESLLGYSSRI